MSRMKTALAALFRQKDGNIAILAAVSAPTLIFSLAMGIDYGQLTLQRRALQQHSDLAAISAVADISKAEAAVLKYFELNNKALAVRSGNKLLTRNGEIPFNEETALTTYGGFAELIKGRYSADPTIAPDKRFEPGATPYDAVKVSIRENSKFYFANSFADPPRLYSEGTATSQKLAAFSIGTRLASLNNGLLNNVLGKMLGTTVSLSVMDYQALLDTDINVLKVADNVGVGLGLTAATYTQVLDHNITYGAFLTALKNANGLNPNASSALNRLQQALNTTQLNLKLEQLVNLDPYGSRIIGQGDHLAANASLFDLISAAASAANAGKQLSIDLGLNLPGLASATLKLAIGQPPVGTPLVAVGSQGSIVRTAQTRVSINVSTKSSPLLDNLKVNIPLYIELANAEARLSKITCYGNGVNNATVEVEAVPGVAEIALGTVDTSAFNNFGSKPRVTKATLVNALLLKINAKGHVLATNMDKKTLQFLPSEIQAGEVKTVSTSDTLASLTSSLIGNLELEIQTLLLTLSTPKQVQQALGQVLATALTPIDDALYNTLLLLGIRVGEADVRVTNVSCKRPVLIN